MLRKMGSINGENASAVCTAGGSDSAARHLSGKSTNVAVARPVCISPPIAASCPPSMPLTPPPLLPLLSSPSPLPSPQAVSMRLHVVYLLPQVVQLDGLAVEAKEKVGWHRTQTHSSCMLAPCRLPLACHLLWRHTWQRKAPLGVAPPPPTTCLVAPPDRCEMMYEPPMVFYLVYVPRVAPQVLAAIMHHSPGAVLNTHTPQPLNIHPPLPNPNPCACVSGSGRQPAPRPRRSPTHTHDPPLQLPLNLHTHPRASVL